MASFENHHNFAWRETHAGRSLIVHRKGATPAGLGEIGYIPGTMADPGFLVEGTGNEASLRSCSHGAGRALSRKKALQTTTRNALNTLLKERKVTTLSCGLDESPHAYKDIKAVMGAQSDLVQVLATFMPRVVKMAPPPRARSPRINKSPGGWQKVPALTFADSFFEPAVGSTALFSCFLLADFSAKNFFGVWKQS